MAEKFDYSAPQAVAPPVSSVEVVGIQMFRKPPASLFVLVRDDQGRETEFGWVDDSQSTKAIDTIRALNKANLSTKSLERRALEFLVAEGKITAAGTITGSPD